MEPNEFWINLSYVLLILLIPVIATYWTKWGFWENFQGSQWEQYVRDEYEYCSKLNAVPTMSPKLVLRTNDVKQIYYDNCRCENKFTSDCIETWKTPKIDGMPRSIIETNPQNIFIPGN
jgi:hypothetical protein